MFNYQGFPLPFAFNRLYQVQGLLIGCVSAFVIFITVIGPEYVFLFSCILFADVPPSGITVRTLKPTRPPSKVLIMTMP